MKWKMTWLPKLKADLLLRMKYCTRHSQHLFLGRPSWRYCCGSVPLFTCRRMTVMLMDFCSARPVLTPSQMDGQIFALLMATVKTFVVRCGGISLISGLTS